MALQGPIPVEFGQAFPHGAFAAGQAEPLRDFDASRGDRFVQSKDKATGEPLWVIEVIDADPQARAKTVRVKVAATVQPVLPPPSPGMPGGWRTRSKRPGCVPLAVAAAVAWI